VRRVCVFVGGLCGNGEEEKDRQERHKERGKDEPKCFPFRGYWHKNGTVLNNRLLTEFICHKISQNQLSFCC